MDTEKEPTRPKEASDRLLDRLDSGDARSRYAPKQATGKLARDIPLYVRSHSDSFSEPLHLSNTQLSQLGTEENLSRLKSPKGRANKLSSRRKREITKQEEKELSQNCDAKEFGSSSPSVEQEGGRRRRCCRAMFSELEPKQSWYLLLFSIIPMNMIFGMNFIALGLYIVEYVEYFETSSSVVGIIAMIRTGIVSIFGIMTSTFMKRFSPRAVAISGGLIMSVSSLVNTFAPNIYVLYVSQGVLGGISGSLLVINSSVLIQQHFDKNRALGGGLGMLGYSLGHLTGPPLVNILIQTYGWRGSHLIMSAVFVNICALGATLWVPEQRYRSTKTSEVDMDETTERTSNKSDRDSCNRDDGTDVKHKDVIQYEISYEDKEGNIYMKPDTEAPMDMAQDKESTTPSVDCSNLDDSKSKNDHEQSPNSIKAFCKDIFNFRYLKDVKFLLMCFSAALARYNIKTFIELGPSKSVSMGMSRSEAAFIISIFSMVGIGVRGLTTLVANLAFVNRIFYYGVGVLLGAAASFLTMIHGFHGQAIAAIMHGIHIGCTNTIQAVLVVDLMGIDHMAKCIALFNMMIGIISMAAAPIGGYLYDLTDNYDIPFLVSGVLAVLAGVTTIGVGIVRETQRRMKQKSDRENVVISESDDGTEEDQPEKTENGGVTVV